MRPRGAAAASAPSLSCRLDTVLQLLRPCSTLVDVGTDHALLPIAAVLRGLSQRALAVDLRELPLRGARHNIERAGVADRVSTLRSDGLEALGDHGADAVVMAGLSGRSIERICDAAPHVLTGVRQLVVQPNQNADTLRAWALRSGWHLRDEVMLEERDQLFLTCAFVPGIGSDPAYEQPGFTVSRLCRLGPLLLARRDPLVRRFYEAQRSRLLEITDRGGSDDVRTELQDWQAACAY